MDNTNIDVTQLIPSSSLQNMSFNDLSSLYEKTMNQYKSLYQQFLQNYDPNGVICGISRAYYWGNQINTGNPVPPAADFTSIAQNSFGNYLKGTVGNSPLQVNNTSLGTDPEPGVPKYFWVDFTNDQGIHGIVSFPEGSSVNWSSLTSNPVWANSSCNSNSPNQQVPSSLQTYMISLQILETNLDTINNQITLYIENGDPNYFSNLAIAYQNTQTMNDQYNKLRDMRKQILQQTFQYQPPLEVSTNFVKQSNYLYLLIFGLLFLTIYIFVYNYYGSFKTSIGQTGGARGKNYLLLFILFVILAIILKFLS